MKRKLISLIFSGLVGCLSLLQAQEVDVTNTYLTNAGFDSDCNYKAADAASNLATSTDGSTVLAVSGWTQQSSGWSAGATFEYGFAGTLNAPGNIPTTAADGVTTGAGYGALGVCAAWTGSVSYSQNVTLPAGSYKIKYNAYNSGPAAYSVSLVGFVATGGDSYLSELSSFTQESWTTDEINFTLEAETTGKIQMGVQAQNAGSGSHGRIFFDDLQLIYSEVSSDASLAGVELSQGSISPAFNTAITEYTVSMDPSSTSVDIAGHANNAGSVVVGDGNVSLINGVGSTEITVTAADGVTTKTYTLKFVANYMYQWDGEGATGTGSEPNNFGWDCTPTADAWAEANVFGIRFQDNVSYTYNSSDLTGRILYVRWDATGGTTTGSVYSYPATGLKACSTYMFTAKIAWQANGSAPNYSVGINSAKDNTGESLIADQVQVSTTGELHDIQLIFTPESDGDYYFTLGSSSAVLGAIRDLSLSEYAGDPFIQVFTNEMKFDSTQLSQTFKVVGYDLTEDISFSAPEGMTLEPATISALDAKCGTTVNATFESKEAIKDGELAITSGELSQAISIKKVYPAFMMPGTSELTDDGTWCWFQDPRAVYYEGDKKQTYTGWITSRGKVEVASYNHETGEIIETVISPDDFMQVDDHNNPTILVREDGRIMVSYSGHFYGPMRVIVSTNPEDITSFGEEANFGDNVTYANPYQIGDETVMFYRDGVTWHPTINVSMDGGLNWGTPKELITRNGSQQRPYVKYTQDSSGGIHMIFTTGHPRQEANNKIYYAYFKDNKFYRANGTLLKDFAADGPLNIDAGEVETIYDASLGKGWTWDIALDDEENPVALFAAFPDDLNHNYYYASWDGSQWITNHIVNSGKWFPQTAEGATEAEPNYSGGMVLDPNDPSIVYLSKQVDGIFEIYKYVTSDRGATWETTAITEHTPEGVINVRPIIPRGHKKGSCDVIWLRGRYNTYANYLTKVMMYSPNTLTADLDSIQVGSVTIADFDAAQTTYEVELSSEITEIPQVSGFSDVPFAQIEVTQATKVPGQAIINVTSEGGVTTKTYMVNLSYGVINALNEQEVNTFRIYPNPTSGKVTLELHSFKSVSEVTVSDIHGKTLQKVMPDNNQQITLSFKEYSNGLYFISVMNKGVAITKKIVKND